MFVNKIEFIYMTLNMQTYVYIYMYSYLFTKIHIVVKLFNAIFRFKQNSRTLDYRTLEDYNNKKACNLITQSNKR